MCIRDRRATLDGACASQPTTLSFAHAAPYTELLTVVEGVLETVLTRHTTAADLFGFSGRRAALGLSLIHI